MLTYNLTYEEEVMKTVFVGDLDDLIRKCLIILFITLLWSCLKLPNMVMSWAIVPSYLVRNFCLYNMFSYVHVGCLII